MHHKKCPILRLTCHCVFQFEKTNSKTFSTPKLVRVGMLNPLVGLATSRRACTSGRALAGVRVPPSGCSCTTEGLESPRGVNCTKHPAAFVVRPRTERVDASCARFSAWSLRPRPSSEPSYADISSAGLRKTVANAVFQTRFKRSLNHTGARQEDLRKRC